MADFLDYFLTDVNNAGRAHAGGQAILLVTHDARVASRADRVLHLFDGMVADDAPVLRIPPPASGVCDVVELRG